MTDITELAQRMKAAAEKASNCDWVKESGDGWEACCSANDQANGGFIIAHFEGPDAAENREFVQVANPANVKLLVEALEKAQNCGKIYQQSFFRQSLMYDVVAEAYEEAKERIAEDVEIKARLCRESNSLFDRLRAAEKRIAELESRTVTAAAADVLAERQRQVTAEGWTAEGDDSYQNSELADAAACYAIHAHNQGFSTPAHWPWSTTWWKQTNPRRDLVKAGALILAEIERIDRAAGIKVEVE